MTDTDNTTATASKSPTHVAYHVREGKSNDKGFWTRIGAAWAHKDGKGFNIQLDGLVPLDGGEGVAVRDEAGRPGSGASTQVHHARGWGQVAAKDVEHLVVQSGDGARMELRGALRALDRG